MYIVSFHITKHDTTYQLSYAGALSSDDALSTAANADDTLSQRCGYTRYELDASCVHICAKCTRFALYLSLSQALPFSSTFPFFNIPSHQANITINLFE